ncbi:LexA family transcriptional regulator [Occallatibacter riparius]|uniref:XRE family transcriptional regulator n=1 Tax=Occallatibacter riparius TaxID=1002689 RepID=A0A9J7BHH6_9BACT|nr:XRE family transcriptional regulator [Occallatibacter riparius]UWZ81875.1 XRE family transcriptional regulator [Occallatibacter riparius]
MKPEYSITAQPSLVPEWADRILRLISDLKITQARLAERLGVSPATVSRWIQGKHEPTAEGYVALGNLAPRPDAVYFWERAGMDVANLPDTSLHRVASSLRVNLDELNVVAGKRVSKELTAASGAVAIPLLHASAYGDPIPPGENVSLAEVEVEELILAPLAWCPNPEHMIGMHLQGDSMMPVVPPGSILFVDTSATDRDQLDKKLVVVSHRDLGFKVARLQRLEGTDLLISANHRYLPLDVSNASKWKVFGQILWWVSRDTVPAA